MTRKSYLYLEAVLVASEFARLHRHGAGTKSQRDFHESVVFE